MGRRNGISDDKMNASVLAIISIVERHLDTVEKEKSRANVIPYL
jgi:hypothetical protein